MNDHIRMPQPGEGWRDYKGGYQSLYEIMGIATHTENGQPVVVYRLWQRLDAPLYVRPLEVFMASLRTEDGHRPRFVFERPAHETA